MVVILTNPYNDPVDFYYLDDEYYINKILEINPKAKLVSVYWNPNLNNREFVLESPTDIELYNPRKNN